MGASVRSQVLSNHQKQNVSFSARIRMGTFIKPDFDPARRFFLFDNVDKESKSSDPTATKYNKKQTHATLMIGVSARIFNSRNEAIDLANLRILEPQESRVPTERCLNTTEDDMALIFSRLSRSIEAVLKEFKPGMFALIVSYSSHCFRALWSGVHNASGRSSSPSED
jgi:hypothetical protein